MSFPPDRQFIGNLRWMNVIQTHKWSSIRELGYKVTDMIEKDQISLMQVAVAGYEQIQRGFDGGQPYQVIAEITPSLNKGRFTFLPVAQPVEHQTIHEMWDTLEDRKARLRAADPSLNSFPSDSSTLSLTAADSYRSALDELDGENAEMQAFPEDLQLYYQSLVDLLGPSPPRPCRGDVDDDDRAESAMGTTDFSNDHLWWFLVDDEAEEEEEKAHEGDEANSSYTGSSEALQLEIAQKMKMVPIFQPAIVHQLAAAKSEAALTEMWLEPVDNKDNGTFYVGSPAALFAEISQEMKTLCALEPVIVHQLTAASSESAVIELWSPRSRPSRVADSESSYSKPICVSDVPGYGHDTYTSPISDDVELEGPVCSDDKPAASDSIDASASSVSAASCLESCSDCQSDSYGSASPCSDFSTASEVATPATSALGTSTPATEAEDQDGFQKPPTIDAHDLVGLGLALGSARSDSLFSPGQPSTSTNPVSACDNRFPRILDADAGVRSNIKPPDVSQGFVRISGRQLPRTLDTDSQFGNSPDVMPLRTSSFVRLSGRRVEREMGSFSRYDLMGSPGASESKTGGGFKGRLKSKRLPNFVKKIISRGSRKPCA